MGFEILPGDVNIDGIPVTSNHDGWGRAHVLFRYDVVSG